MEWVKAATQLCGGKKSIFLTRDFVLRNNILKRCIFRKIADDIAFQRERGPKFNAKYLSALAGEQLLLDRIERRSRSNRTALLSAKLTHNLPLLNGLSINDVLKVRKAEFDSFLLYRDALTRIVKQHFPTATDITDEDAAQIYEDILVPELLKLRAKLKALRGSALKRSIVNSGITAAVVVGISYFTGMPAGKVVEAFETAAGMGLTAGVAQSLFGPKEPAADIKNHELFFLLRLSERLDD